MRLDPCPECPTSEVCHIVNGHPLCLACCPCDPAKNDVTSEGWWPDERLGRPIVEVLGTAHATPGPDDEKVAAEMEAYTAALARIMGVDESAVLPVAQLAEDMAAAYPQTADEAVKIFTSALEVHAVHGYPVMVTGPELEAFAFRDGVICGVEFMQDEARTAMRYRALLAKMEAQP